MFFVDRKDRKFIQAGRIQNEESSKHIDEELQSLMICKGVNYTKVSSLEEVLKQMNFQQGD